MSARSIIVVMFMFVGIFAMGKTLVLSQFDVPQKYTDEKPSDPSYAPNEVLVTFTTDNDPELLEALVEKRTSQRASFFGKFFLALDTVSLKLQGKQAPETLLEPLQTLEEKLHVVSRTPITQQDVKEGLVTYTVKTDDTLDPLVMASKYEKLDIVESAQPNYYYSLWD